MITLPMLQQSMTSCFYLDSEQQVQNFCRKTLPFLMATKESLIGRNPSSSADSCSGKRRQSHRSIYIGFKTPVSTQTAASNHRKLNKNRTMCSILITTTILWPFARDYSHKSRWKAASESVCRQAHPSGICSKQEWMPSCRVQQEFLRS